MELKGEKVVILPVDLYKEVELLYPFYSVKDERAEMIIVEAGSSDTYYVYWQIRVSGKSEYYCG